MQMNSSMEQVTNLSRGQVAWLLWGGSINKENQMDAQKWAERYVATLEEEDRRKNV